MSKTKKRNSSKKENMDILPPKRNGGFLLQLFYLQYLC